MSSDFSKWISTKTSSLEARRGTTRFTPVSAGRVRANGAELVDLASNDYLGHRFHPVVIDAFARAAAKFGVGSGSSALVSGRSDLHEELEALLCDFEAAESALLFPTGFAANLGSITALCGPDDVVFCERFNHASLVDGCRHSGATLKVYRSTHLDTLSRRLSSFGKGRRFIVTDSVFSMDGIHAPLAELAEIAQASDATLIVDEAHATGVVGANGSGLVRSLGLQNRCDVRIGTLSKAIGAMGGFVIGSKQLTSFLFNAARTQFFSTSLPPAVCAASIASIGLVRDEPWRRKRVSEHAEYLRGLLAQHNIPCLGQASCPIVPMIIGNASRTLECAAQLQDQGFLVPAIRPPTVSRNSSRLRISLSAEHSDAEIERLGKCLVSLGSALPRFTDRRRAAHSHRTATR